MTTVPRSDSPNILIVDDQPSVRTFVTRVLNDAGYTTTAASDGPDALKAIERLGAIHLLVTDVDMPEMRGDELARRVRHADPSVKVLYVTAHRDQLFQATAVLGDHEAFLDKPFRPRDLLEAIARLLASQLEVRPAERTATAQPTRPTLQTLRVLIVEDSEADALLIQEELKRTRFEVESVRVDTRAALMNALARETWDLIITDHTMPQLNAMAVLRMVRDRGLTMPCVLVSGTASEQTAAAAIRVGADDFVSKDNLRALGPSVARALDDADTRRARSNLSRLRLPNGQEFGVVEWAPNSAILTGLVGLGPGHAHDCLLVSGEGATRVRIHVVRSEVATLTAGSIVYQTVVDVLSA